MRELAVYDTLPTEQLRDRVMDDLVKHYSQERIDLAEFERRTDLVSKAATREELVAQVADLSSPADAGRPAQREDYAAPRRADRGTWSIATGQVRASDATVAIFGGSDLRGNWRAPRRLSALCLFGGTNIDLRKAIVPAEGLTISCACAFGGADIIIPPGMRVMTRGMGIFGGFDRADHEPDDPEAPTIVVEGIAVFGGVSVKVKA
jgi:Domain of unknown function (DUF1707)./Predicted membrane protein (DUF2154).